MYRTLLVSQILPWPDIFEPDTFVKALKYMEAI